MTVDNNEYIVMRDLGWSDTTYVAIDHQYYRIEMVKVQDFESIASDADTLNTAEVATSSIP